MILCYPLTVYRRSRILTLLFLFFACGGFAQQDPAIANLLMQRAALIQSGETTSATDLQLYSLGHVPTAVLFITSQPGSVTARWNVYRSVSPARAAQVFTRLSSHYNYLLSIQPSADGMAVTAKFQSGTTAAQIGEISNHFGFQGYEEY